MWRWSLETLDMTYFTLHALAAVNKLDRNSQNTRVKNTMFHKNKVYLKKKNKIRIKQFCFL